MAKQTFTTGQVLTAAQMASLQQTAMGGGSTTAKTASYVLVAADAGTVVQMNSASATTITVNTALFSAGDTVKIMNIGAGVCTVTAGTATVSTAGSLALPQFDGGDLYFNSASAALFFDIVQGSGMTNPLTTTGDTIYSSSGTTPARLGIGSTGQVLTVAAGVPSWATAGGGSMTLLSTTTLSGASVTLSSISQSFRDLRLEIKDPTFSTNDKFIGVRVNADTGNNYDSFNGTSKVGVANSYTGAGGEASFNLTRQFDMQNTSVDAAFMINLYDYKDTTSIRLNDYIGSYQQNNSRVVGVGQFYYNNVGTTISSITILMSAGTFSTGTAYLYGVN